MIRRFALSTGFVLLTLAVFSQSAPAPSETEFLSIERKVIITSSERGLAIQEEDTHSTLFGTDFDKHSHDRVYSSDFHPLGEIEASTLTPRDGKSYKKTKVSTFEHKDIVEPGIFYGGSKTVEFVYPNLSPGAIGKLSYTHTDKDIHLILPFFFEAPIPVRQATFTVVCPTNVIVKGTLYGLRKGDVKFSEVTKGDTHTLTWQTTNNPAFNPQPNSPVRYHLTHIILTIDSYERNGSNVTIAHSLDNLYAWNYGLAMRTPSQGDYTELNKTIDQLAPQSASKSTRTKAIYQWVQKNIKYIAFEDGMSGFVPREPSDVFQKRYGDCKDMANLLRYMLTHAGVDAYLTWIGTRSLPYAFSTQFSPGVANHMICAAKPDTSIIFLDGTDSRVAFGNPSAMIQGKEGLIGLGYGEYKVMNVPIVSAQKNKRSDSLTLTIDGTSVSGNFSSVLTGYRKNDFERVYSRASAENKANVLMNYFDIGENNIQLTDVRTEGLNKPDEKLRVSFSFLQTGHVKNAAGKIYINPSLVKFIPGPKISKPRNHQLMEEEYQYEYELTTLFNKPSGKTILTVPKGKDGNWNLFDVTSSCVETSQQIIAHRTIHSSFLYLEDSKTQDWNSFIQTINDINQQVIVIANP